MDKDIDDKELDTKALDEMCDCGKESEEDCSCGEDDEEDLTHIEESEKSEEDEVVSESDDKDDEKMDDLVEGLAKVLNVKKAGVAALKEAFLTAVKLKTEAAEIRIEQNLKKEAREAVQIIKAKLEEDYSQRMNGYAKVIVTEWLKENHVAIKATVEANRHAKIVEGVRKLFAENAYTIKDGDKDVVEALSDELEDLKVESTNDKAKIASMRKLLESTAKKEEIAKYKLTEAQAEKVYSLVESFPVDAAIKTRIKTMVELIESAKPAPAPRQRVQENAKPKPIAQTLTESFAQKSVVKPHKELTAGSFLRDLLND